MLGEHDVALHDVELVAASPLEAEYLAALSGLLGLSADQLVTVERADRVHTAALVMGIETAVDQGRWAAARKILLISGGGGVTAGAALLVQ